MAMPNLQSYPINLWLFTENRDLRVSVEKRLNSFKTRSVAMLTQSTWSLEITEYFTLKAGFEKREENIYHMPKLNIIFKQLAYKV